MVPSASHPNWAKLIRGELAYTFTKAGAGLLFFSLQQRYKRNPDSLRQQIETAREFFEKYESILADDMKKLFP